MDLSIIKKKLESQDDGSYVNPEELVTDIRLIFFNCAKYYKVGVDFLFLFCLFYVQKFSEIFFLPFFFRFQRFKFLQSTSEIGCAGLYLEDYFEEQLKLIFPDRLFPGGREEQMIPPLEDEIDDEEEPIREDAAVSSEEKPQSPAGKETPPAEEEKAATKSNKSEEEKPERSEEEEKDRAAADGEKGVPTEKMKQEEAAVEKPVENCVAAATETEGKTFLKEEIPQLPIDKPPETQENPAPTEETVEDKG